MHSFRVKILNTALLVALTWIVSPWDASGQEPTTSAEFQQKADRLERIVLRRPRRGKAFDLWIEHYQDANRLNELIQQMKQQVEQDRDNPALLLTWGMINQRTQQRQLALDAFRQVCLLKPLDYYPRMLLGEELLRQQQAKKAADELSTALKLRVPRQDYLPMAKQLASAYQSSGEPERAREVWSQLADQFSNDFSVLTEIASYLQNEGDTASALRILKSIKERSQDPFQKFSAALQSAQLLLQTDQPQLAAEQLKPLLNQVKLDSWRGENVQSLLEQALLSQGGPEQLVTFWSNRLQNHPNELTTMVRLATALSRADRSQEAEQVYQQAIRQAPERDDLHQGLVDLHLSQGDFAAAIEQVKVLTKVSPKNPDTWLQLGQLHLQQAAGTTESHQLAIEAWQQMAAIRPTDATLAIQASEACLNAATRQSSDRRTSTPFSEAVREKEALLLTTAEQFLREAIRRDPNSAQQQEYLAELLYRLDRREEALEACLQMAADKAPESWHEAARTLERFDYLDEAVTASQQAVQGDDQNLALRQHAIQLLVKTGAHQQAIDQLDHWTEKDSRTVWLESAIQLRIEVVTAAETIEQEIARLSQHTKSHPTDRFALWSYALLLSATRQPTEATASMGRAVDQEPNNTTMVRQYAALLETANRPALAVEQYRRLLKLDPARNRDDYQRIVDLELRQNNLTAAQDAAKLLVRAAPNDPESHLLKATVAMRQGDLKNRLSALSRAVQVAPRDLQMRRQYATALRQDRQTQAALDEAFACLELAESVAERRSILSWILDWNAGLSERKWLLNKVRQIHQQQAKDYNSTLCLVHLLDRMNQPKEALQELVDLQRQYPVDASLLKDLVRLADATNQSGLAVKYQEQLVRIDPSPLAMEQLARLYRQNNQLEAAVRIWDDLLTNTTTPNQTITLVDRLLELEDIYQAQRFVESGLAAFPNNWQLAYRSGLLHLAMSQPAAARKSFTIILEAPSKPIASPQPTPTEYHQLTLALRAFDWFQSIAQNIDQHGVQSPRTLRQLFTPEILNPGNTVTLANTQIFAAIAMLTLGGGDDEQTEWISQLIANKDATERQLQVATIATWVSFQAEACGQATARLREASPDNAIPNLISVLNPPTWGESSEISVRELQSAIQWLKQHHPQFARDTQPLYLARLFYHPDRDAVRILTRQKLETADNFSDVASLIPLVQKASDAELTQIFFANVDRHLPRDTTRIKQHELWATITFCTTAADWNQSSHTQVTLELLELFLSHFRPNQSGISRAKNDPYAKLVRQLSQTTHRQLTQFRDLRGSQTKTNPSQRYRTAQQKQRQILESETSGSFHDKGKTILLSPPLVAAPNEPKWFPTPIAELDRVRLGLIKNIALRLRATNRLSLLIDHLRQSTAISEPQHGRSFDLAQVYAHWYANQEVAAIGQLAALVQHQNDDGTWPLLLVRAHLERGDLKAAFAALNSISVHEESWQQLRRAIASSWSKQALHRDLEGHTAPVSSIAYHPDNRRLASASIDQTVRIWDTITGKLEHTLTDHDDIVLALAFSPSGDLLASAGYDQKIRVWNANTLQLLATMAGHTSTIRALAFSPDGQQLASAGDDRQPRLWDLKTFRQTKELSGHLTSVTTIAYSPNGQNIASGDSNGTIFIWDRQTATASASLKTDHDLIRSIAYTSDNDHFISSTDDNVIQLWKRSADQWLAQNIPTDSEVRDVSFHPSSNRLVIGLNNNSVIVCRPDFSEEHSIFQGHARRVLTVCFSPDGNRVASAGFDGTIKIWNTLLLAGTE
ncbi:MAG: tetratricopeptide repeat protein [Planctomycetaceae bacterium]|nr:tetratricopeptide repeat protein [Planctomycetaceae bacterium]